MYQFRFLNNSVEQTESYNLVYQIITMQSGTLGQGQRVIRTYLRPNPTKYLALKKKNEHFEVAFELYLRYIISILINDGAEMAC